MTPEQFYDKVKEFGIELTEEQKWQLHRYYELLVGHGTDDKWMNNANFSNGVIYKIELKDGWVIEVVSSHHPEVIDLNKNDKAG